MPEDTQESLAKEWQAQQQGGGESQADLAKAWQAQQQAPTPQATAQPKTSLMDTLSGAYHKITEPIHPELQNPIARTTASAVGTMVGMPESIYQTAKQSSNSLPSAILGPAYDVAIKPAIDAVKGYAELKPSWEGIKSVLPEALGQGIGNVAPGEMLKGYATKLSEAGRLLKQQDAINRGQVQVVNEMVRKPLAMFDNNVNQEIGSHFQAAIQADDAARARRQTGMVNAYNAAEEANKRIGNSGTAPPHVQDLIDRASQPLTLNEAKNLTTDVGRQATALSRQGNGRGAYVLNGLYDGLHEATQAQADSLGMGESWKQGRNLTRSYKGLQEGLLGELVDDPVHANVMNKIIDPKRGAEWGELVDELDKRGIDTTALEQAREHAKALDKLQKRSSNLYMSKIRGIWNHPIAVGVPTAGAYALGHTVPGGQILLPLLVAGKLSGLLDARDLSSILKEINSNVPRGAEQAGEALPQPMQPQTPNVSTEPLPPKPAGPLRPGQMTRRELADHIRKNQRSQQR